MISTHMEGAITHIEKENAIYFRPLLFKESIALSAGYALIQCFQRLS